MDVPEGDTPMGEGRRAEGNLPCVGGNERRLAAKGESHGRAIHQQIAVVDDSHLFFPPFTPFSSSFHYSDWRATRAHTHTHIPRQLMGAPTDVVASRAPPSPEWPP